MPINLRILRRNGDQICHSLYLTFATYATLIINMLVTLFRELCNESLRLLLLDNTPYAG